eukprot:CAMPEP_0197075802 /NCGR_PEP_ID=MMETSP1384-20130603/211796_1 /TAXON_ID=29189 /ORGANISM="Ammonia sp." /LENGTH=519 /DNA_ID=CAMNT_0042514651 /DNA_START=37 /DNA_END=1596 /DNA_ORIENTATION=-
MAHRLRKAFYARSPTPISYRIQQLKNLIRFLDECENELIAACQHYYGGGHSKHFFGRLWIIKKDAYEMINNLEAWMKPDRKPQAFPLNVLWSASVEPHPLGVVAIIAPWNFPLGLLLRPLVGAIGAGNAVMLKPSEITDKVARVLHEKLLKYLDPEMIGIVCGGVAECTALMKQKLDFVLYTGGGPVGKIIMSACSKQLTPCALELGGKNPVIIDDDCDLDTSLKRILMGRFDSNAGQICVSPEYIFLSASKQKEAIQIIRKHLLQFYGSDGNTEDAESYFNIVNSRHFQRIEKLRNYYLQSKPDQIAIGGANDKQFGPDKVNPKTRHLPPMVLCDVDFNNDKIMEDEVFGPILSIIPMRGSFAEWKEDALKYIRSKDKPLACYIFSRNPSSPSIQSLKNRIAAGTICINEVVMFMILKDLPFGGVGESGMGSYNGVYSFRLFSQQKAVAICSHGREALLKSRYPKPGKVSAEEAAKQRRSLEAMFEKPTSRLTQIAKYSAAVGVIVGAVYYYKKYMRS